jgi:hypothetical protein
VTFVGSGPSHPDWKVDDVIEPAPVLCSAYRALNRCSLCLKQLAELVGRHPFTIAAKLPSCRQTIARHRLGSDWVDAFGHSEAEALDRAWI